MAGILLTVGLPSALQMFKKCVSKEFQQCQEGAGGRDAGKEIERVMSKLQTVIFFNSDPRSAFLHLESQNEWMDSFIQATCIYDMLAMMQALYQGNLFPPRLPVTSQQDRMAKIYKCHDWHRKQVQEIVSLQVLLLPTYRLHSFTYSYIQHMWAPTMTIVCSILSTVGIEMHQISNGNHRVTKSTFKHWGMPLRKGGPCDMYPDGWVRVHQVERRNFRH